MEAASKQYTLIKEAREVLFNYCETLSAKQYKQEVKNFGRGSICSTHTHVANTYIHWIGNFALKKELPLVDINKIDNVDSVREIFLNANKLVEEFIEKFYRKEDETLTSELPEKGEVSSTPLALFTHVITHEFHHKGQIVSMGRILGHKPPDTDLIRF